jgi:hypothetical protein
VANVVTTAAEQPPVPVDGTRFLRPAAVPLGVVGPQLPIGVLRGSELHRGFALARFSTRTERELEEKRRNSQGPMTNPEWITRVLMQQVQRLGPYDFTALSDPERRIALSQCWLVDVLYLILWMRVVALGPEIRFNLKCARCGTEFRAPANLENIDVHVAAGPNVLARRFEFRDGITVNGKEYKAAIVDPPRWQTMLVAPTKGKINGLELSILLGGIRHVVHEDGSIAQPSMDDLDELSKYDLEHLRQFIDSESYGPSMELTSVCPNEQCGHETDHGVDWSWDFFFKSASL